MKHLRLLSSMVVLVALGAAPAAASMYGAHAVSDAASPRIASAIVTLPVRNSAELDTLLRLQTNPNSPMYHHFLSVGQFRSRYSPDAQSFRRVIASLQSHGLAIDRVTSQSIRVHGSVKSMNAAFGTILGARRFGSSNRAKLVATTAIHVDAVLQAAGATVTGLAALPPARVYSQRSSPANRYSSTGLYWFDDLKQAYTYPAYTTANGKGATIGIVISSDILDSDLNSYFHHENYLAISGHPATVVTRRYVEGGAAFNAESDDSFEASLDVQQSLGSAPAASLLLYDIPDLYDDSIIAGYTDVVEDNAADVISSSFGECELFYKAAYNGGTDYTGVLKAEHDLFRQGNSEGQTFLASSGDEAGLECPELSYLTGGTGKYLPSVGIPAADPNVTGVGGTNLVTVTPPSPAPSGSPSLNSAYVRESEFGDPQPPGDPYGTGGTVSGGYWGSGSGVSTIYAKPDYQKLFPIAANGRSVPDVSMHMGGCPIGSLSCGPDDSADEEYFGGVRYGVIGTSCSSPEFAGLLAVKIAAIGSRLGNENEELYTLATAKITGGNFIFHQNVAGYNGVIHVSNQTMAYNPILGVGTPHGRDFIGLTSAPFAGLPQTVTNP